MAEDIMKKIYGYDIYTDFDASTYELDLQGWGSTDPVFKQVIEHVAPKLIVEVGTWKGASAIHMAELAPDATILCIDTWLGSVEHYGGEGFDNILRRVNGFPHLYYQFLSNVMKTKKNGQIIPLPNTSQNAAQILRNFSLRPDLVYIDGSHEYIDVYLDLCAYHPLLKSDGVLIGDDLFKEGVKRALGQFIQEKNVDAFAFENKYIITEHKACVPPEFKRVALHAA